MAEYICSNEGKVFFFGGGQYWVATSYEVNIAYTNIILVCNYCGLAHFCGVKFFSENIRLCKCCDIYEV